MFLVALAACAALAQSNPTQSQQDAQTTSVAAQDELNEAARLNQTVVKLFGERKFDEALPVAKRVLEIRERLLGGDHQLVASALSNLAAIYLEKKKSGEADPLFRRALAILEKSGEGEGSLASDVNAQLGLLKLWGEDYKESEQFFLRALAIREKLDGTEGVSLLPALFNLTDVYFLRRNYDASRDTLARALAILEKQPPRKDPATEKRLKSYLCVVMGLSAGNDRKLTDKVSHAIWRLEEPEKAAEYEKQQREKKERGMEIVAGGVLNGHAVSKPPPEYPLEAKRARAMGTVVVKILVDETGKVIKAEALCGHPLLAGASVDAARKARFTPTLLMGQPVKVSGVITYNYVLQ